ncbi:MAG: hypothetical protein HUK17_01030, partial [Bacteroidales bacterium]|nr:hypothetical protein [Bacteroidales bacterium]
RMAFYFLLALGLYALSTLCRPDSTALMYVLNTAYLILFIAVAGVVEYKKIRIDY